MQHEFLALNTYLSSFSKKKQMLKYTFSAIKYFSITISLSIAPHKVIALPILQER